MFKSAFFALVPLIALIFPKDAMANDRVKRYELHLKTTYAIAKERDEKARKITANEIKEHCEKKHRKDKKKRARTNACIAHLKGIDSSKK